MGLSDATIQTAFDEEAGDASDLASATEVRRWFNEGQSRLQRYVQKAGTLTWTSGDLTTALPTDYIHGAKIDYADTVARESWREFGRLLVIDDPNGAQYTGTARIYYWGDRTALADGATSAGSDAEDYACLYYALHRFFRKLASNRVQYRRYSTLLGANAITVADLQAESDRLLQDFIDARADLPPTAPVGFYTEL